MPNTHKVFISYSSKDEPLVNKIENFLQSKDINCWVAHKSIYTTDEWPEKIVHAIKKCEVIVLVLTKNSNNSREVKKELVLANKYAKALYVFQIHELTIADGITYFVEVAQRNLAYKSTIDEALQKMSKELGIFFKIPPEKRQNAQANEPTAPPEPIARAQTQKTTTKAEIINDVEILRSNADVSNEELRKVKSSVNWPALKREAYDISSEVARIVINISIVIGVIAVLWHFFGYHVKYKLAIRSGKNWIERKSGENRNERHLYYLAKREFYSAYRLKGISQSDSIEAATLIAYCDYQSGRIDTARTNLLSVMRKDSTNPKGYQYAAYLVNDKQKQDSSFYHFAKRIEASQR